MMTYYEGLAKAIYAYDASTPGNPVERWDEQHSDCQARYIRAAQVAAITLHGHNTWDIQMVPIEPQSGESPRCRSCGRDVDQVQDGQCQECYEADRGLA